MLEDFPMVDQDNDGNSSALADSERRMLLHALRTANKALEICEQALEKAAPAGGQLYRSLTRRRKTWQIVVAQLQAQLAAIDLEGRDSSAPPSKSDADG